ncbi:MAG: UDP-N-acetylmuramoylalanyl-D-glutamyl-2,6-diaminopimelate--D-alanyl-D-alanine ligase [Beijerinckiaceae bacterium]
MTMLWTHDDLLSGLGAVLVGKAPAGVSGMSIDTRTIAPGDLFFALQGESRDGHEFVQMALEKGAAAAVVTAPNVDALKGFGALYVVDDALLAMERLGRASRARMQGRVLTVTGSVGKTSTKEALLHVLARQGMTHASVASYNNHWGVPLTLARMAKDTEYGVFEVGMNHSFEILPLTQMVRPHVAIITTVEPVHLEHFPSLDAIADAKGEIFSGLLPGGTAIINRDNPLYDRMKAHASASAAGRIISFGEHEKADVRLLKVVLTPDRSVAEAVVNGKPLTFQVGAPGRHMVLNALAVLAAAEAMGADLALAALALADLSAGSGRGQRSELNAPGGTFTLLDESYNANPASMRAALALLGQLDVGLRGRRIAVLGDMLELGPSGAEMHRAIIDAITANRIDLVFAAGPLMKNLWQALPDDRKGAYAPSSAELQASVLDSMRAGDAMMIKGSLGSRMGPIVTALKSRFPVNGTETIRG